MNLQKRPTSTVEHPDARNESEIHLRGAWLVITRIGWVVIALLAIGIFVAALPPYFAYLHVTNTTSPNGPQLAPSDVRELQRLGLSLDFYAWLNIGVSAFILLVYVLVGVVLFWRKPDDRMALLASLTLVLFPIGINPQIIATLPPAWILPAECVKFFGGVCFILFFYLFPSGQFVPRWTRWLMVAWVAYLASSSFFPDTNSSLLSTVLFLVMVVSLIILQIYRYRRVSTPVQRQQTKWVVFGIALGLGSFFIGFILLFGLLPQFFPVSPLAYSLGQIALDLLLLLFPLSIGFAILRARLWEIDRLISRTLVYASLTITLGLMYAGLVFGFQTLLGGFTGQTNDIVIVVSTLVIAALFQPLRRGIQATIDRRFYRRKYDARRTIANFSATLRGEVDLTELSEQLVAVVEETMQPAHVSLWLNKSGKTQSSYHEDSSVSHTS
ncbi:MAG TPA: hypothetical protein VIY29_04270 [Ktedonobacteraceae bacterium]